VKVKNHVAGVVAVHCDLDRADATDCDFRLSDIVADRDLPHHLLEPGPQVRDVT